MARAWATLLLRLGESNSSTETSVAFATIDISSSREIFSLHSFSNSCSASRKMLFTKSPLPRILASFFSRSSFDLPRRPALLPPALLTNPPPCRSERVPWSIPYRIMGDVRAERAQRLFSGSGLSPEARFKVIAGGEVQNSKFKVIAGGEVQGWPPRRRSRFQVQDSRRLPSAGFQVQSSRRLPAAGFKVQSSKLKRLPGQGSRFKVDGLVKSRHSGENRSPGPP